MPEGPEAKKMGEYLNKFFKGNQILSINILKGRYINKDPPCGLHYFKEKLPLSVLECNTKGKFIFIKLENDIYIFNTLGMSGFWTSKKMKHSNVEFVTKKGKMYFHDQRNFGTLKFVFTKIEFDLKLQKIGPDLLDKNTTFEIFKNRILLKKNLNKIIAKVLMDQSIISGIGNYLRSEILWHCRMSPFTKISDIEDVTLKKIYKISRKVIWSFYNVPKALKLKIITENEKKKYNFFNIYGEDEDSLGNKVMKEKVNTRTVHYSKVQK